MAAAEDVGQPAPGPQSSEEDEDRRSALWWLPWVAFVAILLIVAWLIWNYTDLGRPDGPQVTTTTERVSAAVPDVVGLQDGAAVLRIEAAGFQAKSRSTYDSDRPAGEVADQEPSGGTQAIKGSLVLIDVSTGLGSAESSITDSGYGRAVPDVIGMSEDLAASKLSRTGFIPSLSRVRTSVAPSGLVFFQSVPGGQNADPGTTIQVAVSLGSGTRLTTMPKLVGLSEASARRAVERAGLAPRPMFQPKASSVGKVYQQSPAAGESVEVGTLVFYLIGVAPY